MKSFGPLAAALYSLLAASAVRAQYQIVPSSVPLSTRKYWCTQQQTECPLICLQTSAHSDETEQNQCDPTLLTYSCVCSNGLSPNVTMYSQTLPYFICTEWGNQCVSNCASEDPGNSTCPSNCRQDHPCGAQDPVRVNTSTISTTTPGSHPKTTTSSGGGQVCTGFGGSACGDASQTASTGGNAGSGSSGNSGDSSSDASSSLGGFPHALRSSHTLGLVLLLGGFFLGFALVL